MSTNRAIRPADALRGAARLTLQDHDVVNLYNLGPGFYSPLDGFMNEADYRAVIERSCLPSGLTWTVPIILQVPRTVHDGLRPGQTIVLCNRRGRALGSLNVRSVYGIDPNEHAARVFATTNPRHPGVRDTFARPPYAVGGPVELWVTPPRVPFAPVRTPAEMRRVLTSTARRSFVSFSTRNVCHRGHEYLHFLALETNEVLVINIIIGAERPGNFRSDVVVRIYQHLLKRRYPKGRVLLNAIRMPAFNAGPNEAVLQAIMMQNLGFTHFIVGRDHAGVAGFYGKYASQDAVLRVRDLQLTILPFVEPRLCLSCHRVTSARTCRHTGRHLHPLSGIEVRELAAAGRWDDLKRLVNEDVVDALKNIARRRPMFVNHLDNAK